METDEDPAVELVRGMHPKLRRRLEKFLKTQYPVRLLRRNAVDVLKKSFSESELKDLLAASRRGGTALWDCLWNEIARPRTVGSKNYVVYLVQGFCRGRCRASYEAFVKTVKELREQNVYLVLDPRRTDDGGWEIRVGGVGEGVDHNRALWYHRYAKDEVTENHIKAYRRSIMKTLQHAAEKAGVDWKDLVEVRTLRDFGPVSRKAAGLGVEGDVMVLVQSYSAGMVFFNTQIGCNGMWRFESYIQYCHGYAVISGGGELLPPAYWAWGVDDSDSEDEDDDDQVIDLAESEEEEVYEEEEELNDVERAIDKLVVAGRGCFEYDVLADVVLAALGMQSTRGYNVVDFLAGLFEDAVAQNEAAPFDWSDAERWARVRMATGLTPSWSYKPLLSDDGLALRALLVEEGMVTGGAPPKVGDIEASHDLLASTPPAFVKALRAVPLVFPDAAGVEVLAAVQGCKPFNVGVVDRFLAALIRLRATSGMVLELFADATAVAAARRETGAYACHYEWLLGDEGAKVRRLLSEHRVPCTKPVTLDDVEDAYAELLRAEPSPFYEALKCLNPSADLELADEVRVVCLSHTGWAWTGDWGLEPFLELLLASLENGSDELFASASRLALALRECPDFRPCILKTLLDAEDDAGATVRAALRRAGLNVDTLVSWAAVEGASTALYQAVVDVGLVRDGTAATIVALRGIVGSGYAGDLEGVPWCLLDRVLAAALRVAAGRRADGADLQLFEVGTLVDALIESEVQPCYLYKFLKLLEDGDDDARDVRAKLAAIGLDEGKYTAATEAQVKPALGDKRKAARDAVRAAEKKRKAETKPSPRRTRRGQYGN
jgi:hypothetical protein